jgi:hypothetical protein
MDLFPGPGRELSDCLELSGISLLADRPFLSVRADRLGGKNESSVKYAFG